MSISFRAALMTATIFVAAPAIAQAADNPMVGGAQMLAERNIVENAMESADHTTLVAALQAAGLVDTLQGEGPFTVFAPTNAAFDALPAGTVETLLMPENVDALTEVLTCHVLDTKATAAIIGGMIDDGDGVHTVETLGGCMLEVRSSNGMITLTDENGGSATVTIADVMQSNGVIHVVDAVILPKEDDTAMNTGRDPVRGAGTAARSEAGMGARSETGMAPVRDTGMAPRSEAGMPPRSESSMSAGRDTGTESRMTTGSTTASAASDNPMVGGAAMMSNRDIVENAMNSSDHTTLVAAVQAAGLVETLQGDGPFTVFAPTNAAFDKLPAGTVENLLLEENRDDLSNILTSHVVAGNISGADLEAMARASSDGFHHFETVSGAKLSAQAQGAGEVSIFDENGNAHRITIADVNQSNGVIHVVDGVLLPR